MERTVRFQQGEKLQVGGSISINRCFYDKSTSTTSSFFHLLNILYMNTFKQNGPRARVPMCVSVYKNYFKYLLFK